MNDENIIVNGTENAGSTDETHTAEPNLPAARSRNGKIARLPLAIRQQLNQRLQNGEPGKDFKVGGAVIDNDHQLRGQRAHPSWGW